MVNAARKSCQIWNHDLQEKYVTQNFYAFARGEFLVALTNDENNQQHITVPNAPFSEGAKVCNIFYDGTDCQNIKGGSIDIYLNKGESKIYVTQSKMKEIHAEVAKLEALVAPNHDKP